MTAIYATYRTLPGTEAAEGSAGGRTVVVDRPDGVAGGQGLGFNGGELLALALGGCLANDLRYVAHDEQRDLGEITVEVALEVVDGRVTGADIAVSGVDDPGLLERAVAGSTIVSALVEGAPVRVRPG